MSTHPIEDTVVHDIAIPMDSGRLSLAQVAVICRVSRVSVWRWCQPTRRDHLRARRAGRYLVVRPRDLQAFLQQRGVALAGDPAAADGEMEDEAQTA